MTSEESLEVSTMVQNALEIYVSANYRFLSCLKEAKPGYKTPEELMDDKKLQDFCAVLNAPQLMCGERKAEVVRTVWYLIKLNMQAGTIIADSAKRGRLYRILPRGEEALVMLGIFHEAYSEDGAARLLEEFSRTVSK